MFKTVIGTKRGFDICCGLSGTVLSLEHFEFMKVFTIQISEFNVQMFLGIEQYVLYFLTCFLGEIRERLRSILLILVC